QRQRRGAACAAVERALEVPGADRGSALMDYEVEVAGRVRQVAVQRVDGRFRVTVDGREHLVDARRIDANTLSLLLVGKEEVANSFAVTFATDPVTRQLIVGVGAAAVPVSLNG